MCLPALWLMPAQVVSTDAMDEYADWPTRNEDFRFDPPDPSDVTWHRCVPLIVASAGALGTM